MLNRRILRSKAVQYLYGLLQSHSSNYHLAIENIREHFAPDLMSLEPQDRVKLARNADKAIGIFEDMVKNGSQLDYDEDTEIKKAVNLANVFLANAVKRDNQHLSSVLIQQTEAIGDVYVLVLQVIVRVLDKLEEEFKKRYPQISNESAVKVKLMESIEVRSNRYSEDTDEKIAELIYHINKDVFLPNTDLASLFKNDLGNLDAEREMVRELIRLELFKHNLFEALMEEEDFDWAENKAAVKDLVGKTLKNLAEDQDAHKILIGISANWEEDKLFMKELFANVLANKDTYLRFISEKLKNWDANRVAEIDMAILLLAISEMVAFPSIPIKVTINEFLEISKEYSTPKSKEFVNGVLDSVSTYLVERGVIKKSGRGLIDNK